MKRIAVLVSMLALVFGLVLPASAHTVARHGHHNTTVHSWVVIDGVTYGHRSYAGACSSGAIKYTHYHYAMLSGVWQPIHYLTDTFAC